MSTGPMRLAAVADAAGVSLATASRSLRGLTGVSDEVAARVRKTAEDLGYVVNTHAQTLAGGTTSIAGLIVHQIDDPYFTEIAAGVVHAAEERGLIVQVAHSGRDPQREVKQLHSLVAQRARVIVIAGSGYVDGEQEAEARRLLSTYQRNGGRGAVVGRPQLGVDGVLPDNRGAARAVTARGFAPPRIRCRLPLRAAAPPLRTRIRPLPRSCADWRRGPSTARAGFHGTEWIRSRGCNARAGGCPARAPISSSSSARGG